MQVITIKRPFFLALALSVILLVIATSLQRSQNDALVEEVRTLTALNNQLVKILGDSVISVASPQCTDMAPIIRYNFDPFFEKLYMRSQTDSEGFIGMTVLFKPDGEFGGLGSFALVRESQTIFLVTAQHCVSGNGGQISRDSTVFARLGNGRRFIFKGSDFTSDGVHDVAIASVSDTLLASPVIVASKDPLVDSSVQYFGYPGGHFFNAYGRVAVIDNQSGYIDLDLVSSRGASGSAVLISRGKGEYEWIGLISSGAERLIGGAERCLLRSPTAPALRRLINSSMGRDGRCASL